MRCRCRVGPPPSVQGWGNSRRQAIERASTGPTRRICGTILPMPACPECGKPATVGQGYAARCPAHATDKAALHARLHALESAELPTDRGTRDRVLAEADAIERRLGELDGHAR